MITDTHKTATSSLFEKVAVSRTDTPLFINKTKFIEALQRLKMQNSLTKLRAEILDLESNLYNVKTDKIGVLNIHSNGDTLKISKEQIFEMRML
jgi:hypothetical protein